MNPLELRIGNYFDLIDRGGEVHLPANVVCVCTEINFSTVSYHLLKDKPYEKDFTKIPHHSTCGIPLTEEWLFNFGFELKEGFYRKESSLFLRPYGSKNNDEFQLSFQIWQEITSYDSKTQKSQTDIRPLIGSPHFIEVHQLQNFWFAWLNQELTIRS